MANNNNNSTLIKKNNNNDKNSTLIKKNKSNTKKNSSTQNGKNTNNKKNMNNKNNNKKNMNNKKNKKNMNNKNNKKNMNNMNDNKNNNVETKNNTSSTDKRKIDYSPKTKRRRDIPSSIISISDKNNYITKKESTANSSSRNNDNFKKNSKVKTESNNKKFINNNNTFSKSTAEERKQNNRRNNKSVPKMKKRKIKLNNFFAFLLYLFVVAGVILLVYAITIWSSTLIITDDSFWSNQSNLTMYDRYEDEISTFSNSNVTWQELKDSDTDELLVSSYYIDALLAAEDDIFYEHHGIDWMGISRAVFGVFTGQDYGGGSTITMQLAKLLYLDCEYQIVFEETESYDYVNEEYITLQPGDEKEVCIQSSPVNYKLEQMALAWKIESKYSKDEILENYINLVSFDSGGQGIYNGSMYYYGKDPIDLTLAESATLAGMSQTPANLNPLKYPDDSLKRRDLVLGRMLTEEFITQEEYDEAISIPITEGLVEHNEEDEEYSNYADGYVDTVYKELFSIFGEDFNINSAGMEVHTYMDPELQQITWDSLNVDVGISYPNDVMQESSISIDTQTSDILAVGYGRNVSGIGVTNYAVGLDNQPGSSAKPIMAYGPGIEYMDWSTHHQFNDKPLSGSYTPNNWDNQFKGKMTLYQALASSRNTTAVTAYEEATNEIGYDAMLTWMNSFGFESYDDNGNLVTYASNALGTFSVSNLEMAVAYAVFGNGGYRNDPSTIDYIQISETSSYYDEYADDEGRYYPERASEKIIGEDTAMIITNILDTDNPYTLVGPGDVPSMELSAKTGSSNFEDKDGIADNWLVGYSPDVTTASWGGYLGSDEADGYYMADFLTFTKEQFGYVMDGAYELDHEYLHDDSFVIADNVDSIKVTDNKWPAEKNNSGKTYLFIQGSSDYPVSKPEEEEPEEEEEPVEEEPVVEIPTGDLTLTYADTGSSVIINWTDESGTNDAVWEVYVDNSLYTSVTSPSVEIIYSDLYATECKATYQVYVKEIISTPDGEKTRNSKNVTLNFTDNCPN